MRILKKKNWFGWLLNCSLSICSILLWFTFYPASLLLTKSVKHPRKHSCIPEGTHIRTALALYIVVSDTRTHTHSYTHLIISLGRSVCFHNYSAPCPCLSVKCMCHFIPRLHLFFMEVNCMAPLCVELCLCNPQRWPLITQSLHPSNTSTALNLNTNTASINTHICCVLHSALKLLALGFFSFPLYLCVLSVTFGSWFLSIAVPSICLYHLCFLPFFLLFSVLSLCCFSITFPCPFFYPPFF